MNSKLETFLIYFLCVVLSIGHVFYVIYNVIVNGISVFKVKERKEVPSILKDQKYGEHKFVQLKRQGVKIHYVEKGKKDGPMLLFVHGFPECWLSWHRQIEEFSSSSYRVIALDLRGYGDSEAPTGKHNYDIDLLVEDIREFIIEMGSPKTTLITHDWGGIIGWVVVSKHPELLSKHVSINGPHFHILKKLMQTDVNQFLKSWYILFFQCPFLPEIVIRLGDLRSFRRMLRGLTKSGSPSKTFPDQVLEGYEYYFSKWGALTGPLNYYRSLFYHDWESENTKVKVPTLIIWGDEDDALSKKIPEMTIPLCEDVKYEPIQGAGHFLHEEEPEEVNKLIWNFIKK